MSNLGLFEESKEAMLYKFVYEALRKHREAYYKKKRALEVVKESKLAWNKLLKAAIL